MLLEVWNSQGKTMPFIPSSDIEEVHMIGKAQTKDDNVCANFRTAILLLGYKSIPLQIRMPSH
ncbi:hypothetical protein BH160DRAFT_0622 [Burkholderia sp. H160]|nr:hypothetical protein BH160DRAFT_0622 [Burkholderia sp. H160]